MIRNKRMTAKEQIIDFINLIFLIVLCLFVFFYIILGNRLGAYQKFFEASVPLVVFLIPLLIIIRVRRENVKKFKKENNLDEILTYITKGDKTKDKIIIFFTAILVLGAAVINRYVKVSDILQAVLIILIMYPWHMLLFRSKEDNIAGVISLTNLDKIKDEIVIFILPIAMISIAIFLKDVNIVDYLQVILAFVIMHFWHRKLFAEDGSTRQ